MMWGAGRAIRLALYQVCCIIRLPIPGLNGRSALVARLSVNRKLVCHHCREEIAPDVPRWTAREPDEFWHYKCAEEAKLTQGERFRAVILNRSNSG
jgi:hypothetical protein